MNTEEKRKRMVAESIILRGLVGSTIDGTNIGDGTEDRDEMGVCLEPLHYVAGFEPFEQYIYRTAVERTGDHNARSQAGDLDLVVYSLRKYLRLALKGNPSILKLLFVPDEHLVTITDTGRELQELAPKIVSKRAGAAFLGYMQAQHERLLGLRGSRHGARKDRLGPDGYDTKYAMHILRLAYQGIELMETGEIILPMQGWPRDFLLEVRRGEHALETVTFYADALKKRLEGLLQTSKLPDNPDVDYVEDWMLRKYAEKHAGYYTNYERSNRSAN
jgi:predicted nucleotidyltransferase